jgi:hypothetical protein
MLGITQFCDVGNAVQQIVQMKKLLLIIILLYLPVVDAVANADLYSGEVDVLSQGEHDRGEAIPEALIQVLKKLSGQRDIHFSPALDAALSNAGRLVHSFRYKNVDRTNPDGSASRELRLVVQFMRREVDMIVRQAGLPRWQQERPIVQIWVVIDDGRERKLQPFEYKYAWDSIEDVAAIRGLPINWPELDEEEAQLVDMRLIWGGFTDYLLERIAPGDGVAIIAARREGPRWSLRWSLADGKQTWIWSNGDQELMFALAEGIHQIADYVATGNTIAVSEQGSWFIDISIGELHSAEDYAACLGYLQNLSLVTAVEILGADPGRVHFRLQLNAKGNYLAGVFERGNVLFRSGESEYEYDFLP